MATSTSVDVSKRHAGAMKPAIWSPEPDYSGLHYDYEQIAEEHREQVMTAAVHIKADADKFRDSVFAIGGRLLEVKDYIPHGSFTEWLRVEFDLSDRMAQNMMNVAREFGDKTETVSVFSDSVLYLLAAPSTPDETRAIIVEQANETGVSPSRAEVKALIADHRGVVTLPAQTDAPEPPHATLDELRAAVDAWIKDVTSGVDNQLYYLDDVAAARNNTYLDRLVGYLKRASGIDHYRHDDLITAVKEVAEAKRTAKAEKAAKKGPDAPSGWDMQKAIRDWLATQDWTPQVQHAFLVELQAAEEEAKSPFRAPEHQRVIAALPAHWRPRDLKQALSDVVERLAYEIGASEWETLQVPSGRWYAQNHARARSATPLFDRADDALAAIDRAERSYAFAYAEIDTILHNPARGWALDNVLSQADPELVAEIKMGLEQLAAQDDAPPHVAERLAKIDARIQAAQALVAVTVAPEPAPAEPTPAMPQWQEEYEAQVEAIAQAEREEAEPEPSAEEQAAIAEVQAFAEFETWLHAAPREPSLVECHAILELAKTVAVRVRTLEPDLTNPVGNALPTLSQLISRLGKKVKR